MKNINNNPDGWVVVKLKTDGNDYYKLFVSWNGGYSDGDMWRMNSGITKVEFEGDFYYIYGQSGSRYKCHKDTYGRLNSYTNSVLLNLIENSYKVNITSEILPKDSDWVNVTY